MANSTLVDYERVQQITVHVQAIAELEGPDSDSIVGYTTLVVNVNNLNDNSPFFTSDYNQSSIHEGVYSRLSPMAVQHVNS